jgi:hypothetical protein
MYRHFMMALFGILLIAPNTTKTNFFSLLASASHRL